jgi:ABC-2 type transport system ATP-binding protein
VISVDELTKIYRVHRKRAGLGGSLEAIFRRRYEDIHAVENLSFEIAAGEIVGFLGPNGAGKTTTLKMLSGLLYPSAGRATVLGHEPKRREAAYLRKITMVMGQKQQLNWDLPAEDSFLVNQAIYELPDNEYRRTKAELTELLGLEDLLNKQVRKLSLGERMKCELAAALLHRPKVLFLDEPTIGLDVTMQERIRRFIAEYNQRHGATVILTSHYLADVTALAERIIVIDKGRKIFDGDIFDLVQRTSQSKIVKLRLARELPADELRRYGSLHRLEGLEADLLVSRADASRAGDCPVVTAPPIQGRRVSVGPVGRSPKSIRK